MAKIIPPDLSGYDISSFKLSEQASAQVKRIYDSAIKEFVRIVGVLNIIDPDKPFSFSDYPQTKARVAKLLKETAKSTQVVIERSEKMQWLLSAKKNDELVNAVFSSSKLSTEQLQEFMQRNLDGLAAFQQRKVKGLNFSDRIWRYTRDFETELELAIDVSLGEGKSATDLSRDIRGLLNEPNKLFRRVRDKRGVLQLSRAASNYHPGQGSYRSSYMNAMRAATTETNMAYHNADLQRWNQLPFVNGYEVRLSNNHPRPDICNDFQGKYPGSFVFVGWHPFCRCFAVPILCSEKERDMMEDYILEGRSIDGFKSKSIVTTVPSGFSKWIDKNAERSQNWKSQPYFIKDNFKGGRIEGGLKIF